MRVEQHSSFLSDLFGSVLKGNAYPAAFQRPYVWDEGDVEALWESMIKGYPIGSFLMWRPSEGIDVLMRPRLGPIMIDPQPHAEVILDGQNRLASFAWSTLLPEAVSTDPAFLERLSPMEKKVWTGDRRLVADPQMRRVLFVPKEEAYENNRVPAGMLADTPTLWRLIRQREKEGARIGDTELEWLMEDASNSLREARITCTGIVQATPQEALDAFRHIARVGVPISEEDMEAAMAWAMPDPGINTAP